MSNVELILDTAPQRAIIQGMNGERKLSQAEKAQRYDRIMERQREAYRKNADKRREKQRERYRRMADALKREDAK